MEWGIAFPLHPEFRTLPMMWYVPPLSPVQSQMDQGRLPTDVDGMIPKAEALRFPVKYLANLLTAGEEAPILDALRRLIAMRAYQRTRRVLGQPRPDVLGAVGLTEQQAEEMYRYLALANYEDRFVIPTTGEERRHEDYYALQGQMGFSPGNTSAHGRNGFSLFPRRRTQSQVPLSVVPPPKKREEA